MSIISADVDLNTDPFNLHLDDDGAFHVTTGSGTPLNGPGTESAPWAIRMNYIYTTSDPSAVWPGYEVFESQNGVWTRTFNRVYSNGSCTFSSWLKASDYNRNVDGVVLSLNGQTGSLSAALAIS